jgi:threonylcarbamoyladenosine tRNA methylthiotransferase MtaB
LPFTYFHVFPYSPRRGTTAAKRTDHLPAAVIRERAQRLRRLGERKRAAFARGFIGHALGVLVEARATAAGTRLAGYSRNYQRIEFSGPATLANREVTVRVTGARGPRLEGAWQ